MTRRAVFFRATVLCALLVSSVAQAQIVETEILTLMGGESKDYFEQTYPFPVLLDSVRGLVIQTGITFEKDLPVTPDARQTEFPSLRSQAVFLAVYSTDCTELVYMTYFGGSAETSVSSVRWYDSHRIILSGATSAPDLPLTDNARQKELRGESDLWYAIFNLETLDFDYISLIGGSDREGGGFAYRAEDGRLMILGRTWSTDLPERAGNIHHVPNSQGDGVVFVLDQHELQYAVCLGGSGREYLDYMVESDTTFVIIGSSWSRDLFTTDNAFQRSFGGVEDLWILRVDQEFRKIIYSSFLGGSSNEFFSCALKTGDIIHLVGSTQSDTATFPSTCPPIGKEEIYTMNDPGAGFHVIFDPAKDSVRYAGLINGDLAQGVMDVVSFSENTVLLVVATKSDTLFNLVKPESEFDEYLEMMTLLVEFDFHRLRVESVQYLWNTQGYGLTITPNGTGETFYISGVTDRKVDVQPGGFQTELLGLTDSFIGTMRRRTNAVEGTVTAQPNRIDLLMYPNPARHGSRIQIVGPPGNYNLLIYGMNARPVLQRSICLQGQTTTLEIPELSTLSRGSYCLAVYSEEGILVGVTTVVID
jgi:hypothetical protein